ncbi:MAG: flagellar hook-basal body complex protein FliE [Gammaproteobacteria bacterium]|jgi:flagellar hook-basal body complex protein FliE
MSDFKLAMPPMPTFEPGLKPANGASPGVADSMPGAAPGAAPKVDFGALVAKSIDSVNATQKGAAALAEKFELGDPSVDLVRVMVEMQKARVSFTAVSQVRNKLVEAYREVMNMQV